MVQAAVIVASPNPERIGEFCRWLVDNDPYYRLPQNSLELSLRLRDVMMKEWTLIGIPAVVIAMSALASWEGKVLERAESSTLSQKWYVSSALRITRAQVCSLYHCKHSTIGR